MFQGKVEGMLTIDAHLDTPWNLHKYGVCDLRQPSPQGVVDFPRMYEGGLDAGIFALYLPDTVQDDMIVSEVDAAIDLQIAVLTGQQFGRICTSTYDALATRYVPMFLALEGGRLINGSLARLEVLAQKGIKYLTLTHNRNTSWAGSATDSSPTGLKPFGHDVIKACNRLGVIADVSHASDETAIDALECSTKPVMASHSGCRALVNHPRNLSDDLIREIARTDGVICVPFARRFVGNSVVEVVNHIMHIAEVVGMRHVGIGSDLDGAVMADGLDDVSCWRKVGVELEQRGVAPTHVDHICGGNVMRMLS